MTGWRIGMAVGNPPLIDALFRVKTNVDSGIPQAIQRMAIAALEGPQDCIDEHNAIYQRRRDRLVEALRDLGLRVDAAEGQPLRLGAGARRLHVRGVRRAPDRRNGVVVTPGSGYGQYGEGYIRLSLTTPDDRVDEGLRRIAAVPALV